MTIYEKLQEEFDCAIRAIFGDIANQDYEEDSVEKQDLIAIAEKVAFYLDK